MICPHCQGENNEGKKFCKHCGGSLVVQEEEKNICPECNADNPLTAKFCKGCGTSLIKEAIKIDEPNKQPATGQEIKHEPVREERVAPVQTHVTSNNSVHTKKPVSIVMIGVAVLIVIGSISGVLYYKNQDIQSPVEVSQPEEIPTETVVQPPMEENAAPTTVDEPIAPSESEQGNTVEIAPAPLFTKSTDINDEEYLALKSISPAFANADQKLNQAFSKLRKELSASDRERLKKDQIKWIDQRNKEAYNMGAKGSETYIQSLIEQSNQREKVLLRTIPKKAALKVDDSYLDDQMQQLKNFEK